MRITTVVNHFWKWFAQHAETYRRLYKKPEKEINYLLDELDMHLRAYCKQLHSMIGVDHRTGLCTLIITANSKSRYFEKADNLVAKAPRLEHWEILSLYPPSPTDLLLDAYFPGIGIDPARLWFCPLHNDKPGCKKDIIVYWELYNPDKDYQFRRALSMIIHGLLGERVRALSIGAVHVSNLSEAHCKEDLMRLEELPVFVNDHLSYHFEVSAAGKLRPRE